MKILVGIKRVVDYNVRIRVRSDGSGVDTDGVKMSINPFDEIALEQALRIREAGDAEEVIVVSIGGTECQQQLRTGLAMGADRAIQVDTSESLQPLTIARALLKITEKNRRVLFCWANKPSTVITRRRDKCWLHCGIARKPRLLLHWNCLAIRPLLPGKWMPVLKPSKWIYLP